MTQKIARIRIELADIEPQIWRRVEVSVATNLRALHEIIQAVMPWENDHLYKFTVGNRVYGEPNPEDTAWGHKVYHAKNMRLGTLIKRGAWELLYTYDFGDDWRHWVIIEEIADAVPTLDYPVFISGEYSAPPEDIGGPSGFEVFRAAMSDRTHPRHTELARWYGGPFHPSNIAENEIAQRVREIARRRKAALEAFERSRAKRLN